MSTTLTIHDIRADGTALHELSLEFLTEHITVRELIRSRVYQEVSEYNARRVTTWAGLVQPEDEGCPQLTGAKPRRIDWEAQADRAIRAFSTGTLLIVVNDRQVTSLDERIEIRVDTSIAFLRLLPLIGG